MRFSNSIDLIDQFYTALLFHHFRVFSRHHRVWLLTPLNALKILRIFYHLSTLKPNYSSAIKQTDLLWCLIRCIIISFQTCWENTQQNRTAVNFASVTMAHLKQNGSNSQQFLIEAIYRNSKWRITNRVVMTNAYLICNKNNVHRIVWMAGPGPMIYHWTIAGCKWNKLLNFFRKPNLSTNKISNKLIS